MGQPIVVIEKPSVANPGMVRFETNRAISGMGHERYVTGTEVRGNRPPDELARRILARGGVDAVHINGSVITVDLEKGHDSSGLKEIVENLYIFYPEVDDDGADEAEAAEASPETEGSEADEPQAETAEDAGADVEAEAAEAVAEETETAGEDPESAAEAEAETAEDAVAEDTEAEGDSAESGDSTEAEGDSAESADDAGEDSAEG